MVFKPRAVPLNVRMSLSPGALGCKDYDGRASWKVRGCSSEGCRVAARFMTMIIMMTMTMTGMTTREAVMLTMATILAMV